MGFIVAISYFVLIDPLALLPLFGQVYQVTMGISIPRLSNLAVVRELCPLVMMHEQCRSTVTGELICL